MIAEIQDNPDEAELLEMSNQSSGLKYMIQAINKEC